MLSSTHGLHLSCTIDFVLMFEGFFEKDFKEEIASIFTFRR